jgi:hypothetical protein
MDRNISERPENWVIIKITNKDKTYYKVFGTWVGGYLDGDRWKLNSGVSSIEEDEDYYYYYGYSGSCYMCNKNSYGISTLYNQGIFETLKKSANNSGIEFELMDEKTNWFDLIK